MGRIKGIFKALIPILIVISFLFTACESKDKSLDKGPEEQDSISQNDTSPDDIKAMNDAASAADKEKEDVENIIEDKDKTGSGKNEAVVKEEENKPGTEGDTREPTTSEAVSTGGPETPKTGQNGSASDKERTSDNKSRILENFIICIDAGHGITKLNEQEPIAPGSDIKKAAHVSGTRGANQTEEQLNLKVAKKLEKKIRELGADVHMTRTEAECDMSNIDRAEFANNLNADIFIRIHADGSTDKNARGVSMLVPASDYIDDEELVEKSARAGKLILEEVVKKTGAANRGIIKRADLTGFNWSKVPVVLLEMGFMTNPEEDRLLETEEYQDKIVQGIVDGMIRYLKNQ